MTMKHVASGVALAAFVTFAVALPAPAAELGRGGKGHRSAKIEKAIERLDLTQDQRARIKAIREEFKAQHATLITEIKSLHSQARDARKADNTARFRELRARAQAKTAELREASKPMREQILAVLTPEQREELASMRQEHKQKREKKGGKARKHGRADAPGAESDGALD